jgi:Domain of unknown function (DUF5667)
MRDLSQPLQECLKALDEKQNLQEVLRRYPAQRDELIGLLRLSVDLNAMGAPAADPAFRLRARNRMLAAATQRRQARRWNPLAALPRPAVRLAFAGAFAVVLAVSGLTAAAASANSLPGDPLYTVKLGLERAQLAITLDSAARARMQAHFTDLRLDEARQLVAAGRVRDGVRQVAQYDVAVAQFNQSLAGTTLDERALVDMTRLMDARQAYADDNLRAMAGSLAASGDSQSAAAVTRSWSHVDQSWKGSKHDLQARDTGQSGSHQTKPAAQP